MAFEEYLEDLDPAQRDRQNDFINIFQFYWKALKIEEKKKNMIESHANCMLHPEKSVVFYEKLE